jgi:hypothetical protein
LAGADGTDAPGRLTRLRGHPPAGGQADSAGAVPGYTLPEQLRHIVKLRPGDPPAVDVLAFGVPDSAVTGVTLRLAAAHVGESGEFYFDLPRSMWNSGH